MGSHTAERIVDSAITVIARDGLDALSIRRVATETRVAIGTVQHHYPTRAELVLAALHRTVERQRVRAMSARRASATVDTLVARLERLLPHDERSREDTIVWVALAAAAAHDPVVGPQQRAVVHESVSSIAALLDRALLRGELASNTDTKALAERLDAVVNGYLLQAAVSAGIASPHTRTQLRTTLTALAQAHVTASGG
jgi:AcrR family transcriptional regulator